jgi:hypothetical protein
VIYLVFFLIFSNPFIILKFLFFRSSSIVSASNNPLEEEEEEEEAELDYHALCRDLLVFAPQDSRISSAISKSPVKNCLFLY